MLDTPDNPEIKKLESEGQNIPVLPVKRKRGRPVIRGTPGYVRKPINPQAHLIKAYNMEMGITRTQVPMMLPDKNGILIPSSPLERKIIKDLAAGNNVKGVSEIESVSEKTVEEILHKGPVQAYLQKILDRAGATDERLAKVLSEGLEAVQQREFLSKGPEGAEVIEGKERPDYTQRHATAMDIMRLKGNLQPVNDKGEGNTTFNLFQTVINTRKERGLDVSEVIDVKVDEGKK